jgi:hypothetical protein
VSVYHAHLWHMFAAENERLKGWSNRHLGLDDDWFVSLGVIAFAGFGLLVAWVLDSLSSADSTARDRPREARDTRETLGCSGIGLGHKTSRP